MDTSLTLIILMVSDWCLFLRGRRKSNEGYLGSLPTEGLLLGFRSFEVPPAAPLSEFWACSRALYSRATPRSHTQVSFLHCTRRTFPAIVTEMEEFRRANRYKTFFHWNSITPLFSFSLKKDFFPCFFMESILTVRYNMDFFQPLKASRVNASFPMPWPTHSFIQRPFAALGHWHMRLLKFEKDESRCLSKDSLAKPSHCLFSR